MAVQAAANVSIRVMYLAPLIVLDMVDEAVLRVKRAGHAGCGHLPILLRFIENSALKQRPEYPTIFAHIFRVSHYPIRDPWFARACGDLDNPATGAQFADGKNIWLVIVRRFLARLRRSSCKPQQISNNSFGQCV